MSAGCLAVAAAVAAVTVPTVTVAAVTGPVSARLKGAEDLAAARRAALARASAAVTASGKRLTVLRTTAEVLTERFDRAVLAEQQAADAYDVAAARLAAARRTQRADTRRLGSQAAADLEAGAGQEQLELVLNGAGQGGPGQGGPDAYFRAIGMEEVLADNRVDLVAANQADSAVTAMLARQASAALDRRRAALANVDALRTAAQDAVSVQLLDVRSGQARQAAARVRLDRAEQTVADLETAVAVANGGSDVQDTGNEDADTGGAGAGVLAGPPATAGQGAAAAQWALAQIGKPYQWGGAGPSVFDCSGLAMDAWASAGVRMAHWTGDQWESGPHVSLDALRTGDLVFYATNTADPATIHHVGIYIGHGMMVDAPYTGASVRIDSVHQYDGLIGATRPATAGGAA